MKQRQSLSFFLISTLAAGLSISACGNPSNTSAPVPNTGNIPQLATRPTPQSSPLKKLRLSGRVFDGVTGEPIDEAQVWIQVADVIPAEASPPPAGATGAVSTPGQPSIPPNTPVIPSPPVNVTPAPAGMTPSPLSPTPVNPSPPPPLAPGVPAPSNIPLPLGAGSAEGWLWGVGAQAARPRQSTAKAVKPTTEQESRLFRTSTNNQGKFWINDVPEGQHTITIQAPKYRILTLTQVSAGQLDIPLSPLHNNRSTNMAGMVLSSADSPVAHAHVSPSYYWGDPAGLPTQTTALGEFVLEDLPFGKHILAAFVMNEEFVIQQLGFSDEVWVTDKTVKSKQPALPKVEASHEKLPSEPLTNPEKRKLLEEQVENMLKETLSPAPTETAPMPASSASIPSSPADPSNTQSSAPNTPPSGPVENEEEEKQEKPFNLFSAVRELVTGKKTEESDSVKEGSVYPVITLRSVLSDFKVEGTVAVPPGFTYRGMDVYLTLKPHTEERPQEILLFTLPAPKHKHHSSKASEKEETAKTPNTGGSPSSKPKATPKPPKTSPDIAQEEPEIYSFSVRLPSLEKGQSYHFQFTAAAQENGRLLYHHRYEIGENNQKPLQIDFIPAPAGLEISGEEDSAIPPSPEFAWEPVAGAEYYRVLLEAGTPPNNQVIWEAWTQENRIAYPLRTSAGRLKEGELYTVSVAALKRLKTALKSSKGNIIHPGYQTIWSDLSSFTHPPFEVVDRES